jgi:hypothetical protein
VEYITNGVPAWDMGVLDAHWLNMGTTEQIRTALTEARRRRRYGLLVWISPWRRQYLEGLIWALDTELGRRLREAEGFPR